MRLLLILLISVTINAQNVFLFDENTTSSGKIEIAYSFGNDTLLFGFNTDSVNIADNDNLMLALISGVYTANPDSGIKFSGVSPEYRLHYNGWGGSLGTNPQQEAPAQSLEQDAHFGITMETWKADSAAEYRFMNNLGGYHAFQTNGDLWIAYQAVNEDSWVPVTSFKQYKQTWGTLTWARDNKIGRHTINGVNEGTPVPNTVAVPNSVGYIRFPENTLMGWIKNFRYWLIGTLDTVLVRPPVMTARNHFGNMSLTSNAGLGTVKFDYTGNDRYQIYELFYEGTLPADFRSFPNTPFYFDYKLSGDAIVTAVVHLNNNVFAISDSVKTATDWTYKSITRVKLNFTNVWPGELMPTYKPNPVPSNPYTIRILVYVKNGSVSIRNFGIRYLK